jgi:hypothetical protein
MFTAEAFTGKLLYRIALACWHGLVLLMRY